MKALIQRCTKASLIINKQEISSIQRGLVVLIGFSSKDEEDDLDYIVRKLLQIRIFEDSSQKINHSLSDMNGELLIIPQFTLYAQTRKGNRPSFTDAANSEKGSFLFKLFLEKIEKFIEENKLTINKPQKGHFGANMQIHLVNDGPFTILLDSKEK